MDARRLWVADISGIPAIFRVPLAGGHRTEATLHASPHRGHVGSFARYAGCATPSTVGRNGHARVRSASGSPRPFLGILACAPRPVRVRSTSAAVFPCTVEGVVVLPGAELARIDPCNQRRPGGRRHHITLWIRGNDAPHRLLVQGERNNAWNCVSAQSEKEQWEE
eukprot:gene16161-biopygen8227